MNSASVTNSESPKKFPQSASKVRLEALSTKAQLASNPTATAPPQRSFVRPARDQFGLASTTTPTRIAASAAPSTEKSQNNLASLDKDDTENKGQSVPQQERQMQTISNHRLTLNLRDCRYDLFRKIALEELNMRVILQGDQVVTPQQSEQYMELLRQIKKYQREVKQNEQLLELEKKEQENSNSAAIDQNIQKEADPGKGPSSSDPPPRIEKRPPSKEGKGSGVSVNKLRNGRLPLQNNLLANDSTVNRDSTLASSQNVTSFGGRFGKTQLSGSPPVERRFQRQQTVKVGSGGPQSDQKQIGGYQLQLIATNAVTDKKDSNNNNISEDLQAKMEKFTSQNPKELNNWDICWQDFGIVPDQLSSLGPCQRVNHFLGMYNIARKNTLGMHLKRFQKEFPEHYSFFPHTWLYPCDLHEIQEYNAKKMAKRKEELDSGRMTEEQNEELPPVLYIVKPEAGCQGKGIFIARNFEQLQSKIETLNKKHQKELEDFLRQEEQQDTAQHYSRQDTFGNPVVNNNAGEKDSQQVAHMEKTSQQVFVVQKYVKQPALINGHKYDFRIYVLVTSVIDPMTIFLYKDGLVRLASEKYDLKNNVNDMYCHLTNYSLNKKNEAFDGSEHKLKLTDVLKGIMTQPPVRKGKPSVHRSAKEIWDEIEAMVLKTIITVQPQLQHIYRSCQTKEPDICFELLGFDIMLDQKLKPWMIEVNHTPSFGADTGVDAQVKQELIRNTLQILQLSVEHRRKVGQEMKLEKEQQIQQNCYKRLSAKEHSERVRFDPEEVALKLPKNKFKLIYPKEAPGADPELYVKMQNRATNMWKAATGTNQTRKRVTEHTEEIKPKKVKKKKKKPQIKEHATEPQINSGDRKNEKTSTEPALVEGETTPASSIITKDTKEDKQATPMRQLPHPCLSRTANNNTSMTSLEEVESPDSQFNFVKPKVKVQSSLRLSANFDLNANHTTDCIAAGCQCQELSMTEQTVFNQIRTSSSAFNPSDTQNPQKPSNMPPCRQRAMLREQLEQSGQQQQQQQQFVDEFRTAANNSMITASSNTPGVTMNAAQRAQGRLFLSQPTQSSMAKQVNLPNRRQVRDPSHSLQIQSSSQDPNQVLLPFPIATYSKAQLEKMGIQVYQGKLVTSAVPMFNQSVINGGKRDMSCATISHDKSLFKQLPILHGNLPQDALIINQISHQPRNHNQNQLYAGDVAINPSLVNQISHLQQNAKVRQQMIQKGKREENLDLLINGGQIPYPSDAQMSNGVNKIFNMQSSDNNQMRMRYKDYYQNPNNQMIQLPERDISTESLDLVEQQVLMNGQQLVSQDDLQVINHINARLNGKGSQSTVAKTQNLVNSSSYRVDYKPQGFLYQNRQELAQEGTNQKSQNYINDKNAAYIKILQAEGYTDPMGIKPLTNGTIQSSNAEQTDQFSLYKQVQNKGQTKPVTTNERPNNTGKINKPVGLIAQGQNLKTKYGSSNGVTNQEFGNQYNQLVSNGKTALPQQSTPFIQTSMALQSMNSQQIQQQKNNQLVASWFVQKVKSILNNQMEESNSLHSEATTLQKSEMKRLQTNGSKLQQKSSPQITAPFKQNQVPSKQNTLFNAFETGNLEKTTPVQKEKQSTEASPMKQASNISPSKQVFLPQEISRMNQCDKQNLGFGLQGDQQNNSKGKIFQPGVGNHPVALQSTKHMFKHSQDAIQQPKILTNQFQLGAQEVKNNKLLRGGVKITKNQTFEIGNLKVNELEHGSQLSQIAGKTSATTSVYRTNLIQGDDKRKSDFQQGRRSNFLFQQRELSNYQKEQSNEETLSQQMDMYQSEQQIRRRGTDMHPRDLPSGVLKPQKQTTASILGTTRNHQQNPLPQNVTENDLQNSVSHIEKSEQMQNHFGTQLPFGAKRGYDRQNTANQSTRKQRRLSKQAFEPQTLAQKRFLNQGGGQSQVSPSMMLNPLRSEEQSSIDNNYGNGMRGAPTGFVKTRQNHIQRRKRETENRIGVIGQVIGNGNTVLSQQNPHLQNNAQDQSQSLPRGKGAFENRLQSNGQDMVRQSTTSNSFQTMSMRTAQQPQYQKQQQTVSQNQTVTGGNMAGGAAHYTNTSRTVESIDYKLKAGGVSSDNFQRKTESMTRQPITGNGPTQNLQTAIPSKAENKQFLGASKVVQGNLTSKQTNGGSKRKGTTEKGGTHRHSLEKLKQYETQLLQTNSQAIYMGTTSESNKPT